ncbi:MAG TPA: bifunctional shikimate kinase/3-dehydroquinate synthase [Solirubrobacteraceae bacterium]|jgi:shikimate kinase/3-dehydroquinate synthase|nr:bifunctional shikimate kinase/3-dehydroquinate synthase [Solirubrobacteraceae bacterium]
MAPVADVPDRALVFIGFMGAGKTTVAGEVAATLGVRALDSDRLLEDELGHSVAEEFRVRGEASFRGAEEQLVCRLLEQAGAGSVIALGGGSVLSERVREALEPHLTVLLDIDAHAAWRRAGAGANSGREKRPLASDREAFDKLYASRLSLYERLADAILPALTPRVGLRALPALSGLSRVPVGTRLLWASAASGDYPVLVGGGLLRTEVCSQPGVWPLERIVSRPFCVSDQNVASLYAERLGGVQELIEIAPGERNKTLSSAELVWSALVAGGMTRADHLVALGGGVVGDLAGFCAATYQRGVPVVQVPTTLVAQVDSAYGGKTGVDLPQAKNYVGAYHHPAGVIVDPETLSTLPEAELAAGYAEVLKTALIAGGELWRRVAMDEPLDQGTILACARTKLTVVAEDERDAGRRQVLNLGHTVGHALETVTGYERYRHGEAVGLGLLAALRLSGLGELREQVYELLDAHGLPVALGGEDIEQIIAATMRDKKRIGAQVPFVLLDAPGDARTGCDVSASELHAAVSELRARG